MKIKYKLVNKKNKTYGYMDIIKTNCYIKDDNDIHGPCWYANISDKYIIHVGLEDHLKYLVRFNITHDLDHGTGFDPKNNKYWGWSHRAIASFKVGDKVKKGDVIYRSKDAQELYNDVTSGEYPWMKPEDVEILEDGSGIRLEHKMTKCKFGPNCNCGEEELPISSEDTLDDEKNVCSAVESKCEYIPAESDFQIIETGLGEYTIETDEQAKAAAAMFSSEVS